MGVLKPHTLMFLLLAATIMVVSANPNRMPRYKAKSRRWLWGKSVSDEDNSSQEQNSPEVSVEQNTIEGQSQEDQLLHNLTQHMSPQELEKLVQALVVEDVSVEDMLKPSSPKSLPGHHTKPLITPGDHTKPLRPPGHHTKPLRPPGHHTKPLLSQQAVGHYDISVEDASVEDTLRPQKPGETPNGIHISPGSHTKPLRPPGHHTKPLVAQQAAGYYDISMEDESIEDTLRPQKPGETPNGIHISPGSHTKPLQPPGHHTKPLQPPGHHTKPLVAQQAAGYYDISMEDESIEDTLRPQKPGDTPNGIHISPFGPPGHHTKPLHPGVNPGYQTQPLQRPQPSLRQLSSPIRSQRFFWDSSEESSDSNESQRSNSNESERSNSNESYRSSEEVWNQQNPVLQPRPHQRPYTRPQSRPTYPAPTVRPHPRPHPRPHTRPHPRPPTRLQPRTTQPTPFVDWIRPTPEEPYYGLVV